MNTQIKNLLAATAVTFVLASVAYAQQPTIIPSVNELPLIQQPVYQQPMVDQPLNPHPLIQNPVIQNPVIQQPLIQQPVETVIEQPVQGIPAVGSEPQLYVRPEPPLPFVQPNPRPNPYYFGMSVALKRDRWGRTTLRIVSVTAGSPAPNAGLEVGDEIRRVNGHGFQQSSDSRDAVRLMNSYVKNPVRIFGGSAPAAAALTIAPPSARAQMDVRNVRNGQDVSVNVYPTTMIGNGVAPAAPAVIPATPLIPATPR